MSLPAPDELVGQAEAAEILGMRTTHLSRAKRLGQMPPLVADLAATGVWMRVDVEAWRDGVREFPERALLPLLGVSEVAGTLRVDKSQIGRWRRAGVFPAPYAELRAGPIFLRERVTAFAAPRRRGAAA